MCGCFFFWVFKYFWHDNVRSHALTHLNFNRKWICAFTVIVITRVFTLEYTLLYGSIRCGAFSIMVFVCVCFHCFQRHIKRIWFTHAWNDWQFGGWEKKCFVLWKFESFITNITNCLNYVPGVRSAKVLMIQCAQYSMWFLSLVVFGYGRIGL